MARTTTTPIPMLPVAGSRRGSSTGDPLGALARLPQNLWLRSGRGALGTALSRVAGLAGGRVLVPAYHCLSMIEPVIAHGAQPDFYRVTPELGPDPADLARRLPGARALICAHLFGAINDLAGIRAECDRHGVVLIEDCAHALFGAVGEWGDYVVSSLRKFYPVFDGATLGSARHDLSALTPAGGSLRYQLKAVKNSLETAARHGRMPGGRIAAGRRPQPQTGACAAAQASGQEEVTYSDPRYAAEHYDAAISAYSRWLLRRVDVARMKAGRRRRYDQLRDIVRGLTHMQVWEVPQAADTVPYVVPVLLARPEKDFKALKMRGMPLWRWDRLAAADCPVSERYRLSLVQLPCHQGLRDPEVAAMSAWLREVDAA